MDSSSAISSQQKILEAARAILDLWSGEPKVGLILGTGLGSLADEIQTDLILDFQDIPYFPRSTALGHAGQLVCGELAGVPVVAMRGRAHLYEGYTNDEITFPIKVFSELGTKFLIVSNASGGLNPYFQVGDVMVISDHINLQGKYSVSGSDKNSNQAGVPNIYQSRSDIYDAELIESVLQVSRATNINLHQGVYAAVTGPNYETRAEYRYLKIIGADAVGMSTVPESMVASQLGMQVLALSVITNRCMPDAPAHTSGEEVVAMAESAEPKVKQLVLGILRKQFQTDQ